MPPTKLMREQPARYELEVMDVDAAMSRLLPAFELLAGKRVIVTVSPVPLRATFTDQDVVVANMYSKSVLRVCAERLEVLPGVDYFPSYEIVMSSSVRAYEKDNVHVRDDVVSNIVRYMTSRYVPGAPAKWPNPWWWQLRLRWLTMKRLFSAANRRRPRLSSARSTAGGNARGA
jgi:hypothetical protein